MYAVDTSFISGTACMPTAPNTYQPLFESFENSVGPLTETWGIDTSTFGEVRLYGNRYSTAGMKEPGQDASVGHGYGTYTVTAMLTGTNAGPAIILWPGDNQYPGQEINLAELTPDGTGRQYATVHWNDNGVNNQNIRFLDGVQSGVFHTYQAVWEPGKISFNVDGHLTAIVTDHVPLDYDHGGQNEVFAFLNNNENTSLIVRDISYTPLDPVTKVSAAVAVLNEDFSNGPGGSPPPAPIDVYRFYNVVTQAHFFTASESERDIIRNTLPDFRYEGVGFKAVVEQPGADPIFRFDNPETKTHFFTANVAERDTVMNAGVLHYEGVGFFGSDHDGGGLTEVFRFYNINTDAHFYTSSVLERNTIQDTLPNFRYEGIGFYVPDAATYDLFG
jgi:hypothetical protein